MLLLSVIAREFRESARKKRAHGLRIVFGAAMAAWFCIVALKAKLEGAEALGRAVYDGIVLPLAYGLMLLAPALAAPSIATERKEETLGLLFLTRLRPYHIVLAKFAARLVELLWFVLIALPFLALPILFGGVGRDEVISDALILLGLIIFCTATGVCASAFFRSATAAFVVTVVLLLLLDAVLQIMLSVFVDPKSAWVAAIRGLSHLYEPGRGLFGSTVLVLGPNAKEISVGLADLALGVAGSMAMLFLACRWLRRLTCVTEHLGVSDWGAALTRMTHLANILAAIGACAVAFIVYARRVDLYWVRFVPASTLFSLLILLVMTATVISREKGESTLESLVCTPRSNLAIVNRKILEALRACWGWFALFAAPQVVVVWWAFTFSGDYPPLQFVTWAIIPAIVVVPIGIFCSAFARSSIRAVATSLVWTLATFYAIDLAEAQLRRITWKYGVVFSILLALWTVYSATIYLVLIRNFRKFATRQ